MASSVLAIALSLLFLHAFYRAVESQWPSSYLSLTTGASYAISASPVRYLTFRFGPVAAVLLFGSVSLDRAKHSPVGAVLVTAAFHASLTSARAAVSAVRCRRTRRWALVAMHVAVSLGIVLTAVGVLVIRRTVAGVVPPLRDVSATLWTSLAAAVAAAYLVQLSSGSTLDTSSQLQVSRDSIDADLWLYAAVAAEEHGVELEIVHAFMLVENIQRPRWFRRLEHAWARLGGRGSFGILQVRSDGPLTDRGSVDAALVGPLAGARVPRTVATYGTYQTEERDRAYLPRLAKLYNPSSEYADLVEAAYDWAVWKAEQAARG